MPTPFDPVTVTRQFATRFGLEAARLDPDTPLFSSGLLGYLEMAETLDWIEERMGIRVDAQDVRMEFLDTTRSMCDLAARTLGATAIEVKPGVTVARASPVTVG